MFELVKHTTLYKHSIKKSIHRVERAKPLKMAKNRNLICFIAVLASLTLASSPANASGEPPLLFTFGDSSYDVGNTKLFSAEFDPATMWPYGDSVDYPTGRWSDGAIVPDLVGINIYRQMTHIHTQTKALYSFFLLRF